MKIAKKRLFQIINEELEKFLLETVSDPEYGQESHMNMRFNSLFETGFDGIFQIIEFAEALEMNMPRVYNYISKKLYNLENEDDVVMGYFNYDYEGLIRLFINLTENFGDDFFDSRVRHKAVGTFSAINRDLQIIDRDYNGNREVTDLDYSTYRQATSSPQKRAANRGQYIIDDIGEAFEYLAANTKNESVISEKKKRKRKRKRKLTKKPSSETSLRDWFKRKGAKGSKGGWVDCNAPDGKGGYKSCGRSSGEKRKKYPACRPTPSACKSRGKGKKWGKKGAKRK